MPKLSRGIFERATGRLNNKFDKKFGVNLKGEIIVGVSLISLLHADNFHGVLNVVGRQDGWNPRNPLTVSEYHF